MIRPDIQSSLQSLEEVPPMIASVGTALVSRLQEWPDAPPDFVGLAATCVALADVMAWRCEELTEALREAREAREPVASVALPDSVAPVVCALKTTQRLH